MFDPNFNAKAAAGRVLLKRGQVPFEYKEQKIEFGHITKRSYIIKLKGTGENWGQITK